MPSDSPRGVELLLTRRRLAAMRKRKFGERVEPVGRLSAEAPFELADAFAALHRFRADPIGFADRESVELFESSGRRSRQLTLALRAQSLACRGDHTGAANAMAQALREVKAQRDDELISAGERRHHKLLFALGLTFLNKHIRASSSDAEIASADLVGEGERGEAGVAEFPLEPYLHFEHYQQLRQAKRFPEAIAALPPWIAASLSMRGQAEEYGAIEAATAALMIGADDATLSASLDAALRLLRAAAAGAETRPGGRMDLISFWRGRIALEKAKSSTETVVAAEAVKAFDAAASSSDADVARAANSWLPSANRLLGFTLSSGPLRYLHDSFLEGEDAADLISSFGRGLVKPRPNERRLVLDLSDKLLGDAPERQGEIIIGKEHEASLAGGTLSSLRKKWRRRFGFNLPAVQLRRWDGGGIRVLLDGRPIGAPPSNVQFGAIVDEFEKALLPHLDKLVESNVAAELGLSGVESQNWMPLVRLLLSERTPLIARDALRQAGESIGQGAKVVQAAGDYRRHDRVRGLLWGRDFQQVQLDDALEARLAEECKGWNDAPIVSLRLDDDVKAWARVHIGVSFDAAKFDEKQFKQDAKEPKALLKAQQEGAKVGAMESKSAAAPEARPRTVVMVNRPELRPWLRFLLARGLNWLETPVLSVEELQYNSAIASNQGAVL